MALSPLEIQFLEPEESQPQPQPAARARLEAVPPIAVSSKPSAATKPRIPAEYRELTVDEILTLAPVFEAEGAELPDLRVAQFFGAVKAGRVVGFCVVQAVLHAEPMWIEEGHSEVFKGLVNAVEKQIADNGGGNVFLFVPKGRLERLAATQQMQAHDEVCYFRQVASSKLDETPEATEEISTTEAIEPTETDNAAPSSAANTSPEEVIHEL